VLYNITSTTDIIVGAREMQDSIFKYSLAKGFGEFFWNSCPVCGCASIKTTFWEDGSVEHGECLICKRMSELMELEELFGKEAA
jgi:hypothetical protein